jgi:trans-2,3-dihydro-3-hydroxyanthranilate isomerase
MGESVFKQLSFRLVDVFSKIPLAGNGLAVFTNCQGLSAEAMQKITQEMRQYESIFLFSTEESNRFEARIFTMEEELDFAGHPILGAACVLHELVKEEEQTQKWILELRAKTVSITTFKKEKSYFAAMEQGEPCFESPLELQKHSKLLRAFNLSEKDMHETLPLQVVSTGLPYLIVPVQCSLEKVEIVTRELGQMLAEIGAKFAYILQVPQLEGRTWDNEGRVEDIATGSAAGPVGAYLVRHGIKQPNREVILHQGRFVGRPSQIFIKAAGTAHHMHSVEVSGDVCMVASGAFDHFETLDTVYIEESKSIC